MRKTFVKVGNTLLQLMILSFAAGCLTPISIPTEKIGNRLVVSGQISNLADRNEIQLGRTSDEDRLPIPESGASIELRDEDGSAYFYTENYEQPGTYLLQHQSGIPNHTYHIRITLSNGEVYESRQEIMPETVGSDSLYYVIEEDDFTDFEGTVAKKQFVKIYSTATLSSTTHTQFIRWGTEECYLLSPTDFPDAFGNIPPPCFVTQNADPQRIVLFDGSAIKTDKINNLLVCSREIDKTFFEKHYFTVYQSSISADAMEYWRKVNILANQTGSIFDAPPAEISGNIFNVNDPDEKIYGFFQAVNQNYQRFFVHKEDLPFPLLFKNCVYDPFRPYNDYSSECLDCLSVRNSSHVRPDFF